MHLRAMLAWADVVPGQEAFRQQSDSAQQRLRSVLALAHKVLADREDPKAGDKVISVHDPEASNACRGEIECRGRAKATRADDQHACVSQLALSGLTNSSGGPVRTVGRQTSRPPTTTQTSRTPALRSDAKG